MTAHGMFGFVAPTGSGRISLNTVHQFTHKRLSKFCGTNTNSNLFEMSHEILPLKTVISTNITLQCPEVDALKTGLTKRHGSPCFRCQETTQTLGLGCNGILTKDSGVFQLDFLRTGQCGEVVNPQIKKAAQ